MLQSIGRAITAEKLSSDSDYFRAHHLVRQLAATFLSLADTRRRLHKSKSQPA
ncbi:hypothetical protein OH783_08925 [Kocuria rhizophila]|uniref:hypothetical protein n=1 Tax=Kocuria rhizophila TaxID=72000 RepID=UPI003865FC6C|nr:hypothetical protein OH783_08925 [Kocuria rhizophila]WSZ53199.1 hypothetical protein OG926_08955 [Kocuria rhizophila]